MDGEEIYNVIVEEKIYICMLRYNIVEICLSLTMESIFNNYMEAEVYNDILVRNLYLSEFSVEIFIHKYPSSVM